MPIGPSNDPSPDTPGPFDNIVQRILFTAFEIVGGILSSSAAAAAAIVRQYLHQANRESPNLPISPEQAAAMVVKGVVDAAEAESEARLSGTSPERFDAMVKVTGNPPGPETLLDQWKRGLIDDTTFEHGLRQGYLKDEWIPFYKRFRHVPLTAHSYLQAAVEGHMSLPAAIDKVDGLGVTAEDANLVYETLGNPPGIVQMLHLWKRGLATEGEVDQAIRESHYKNKYIPFIKAYAEYFPPPRTITALLHNGAFTAAQAHDYLMKAGLSDELAKAYVASALHVKMSVHKELSASAVTGLYEDRIITREQAVNDLAKINYAPTEANLLLDLADAKAKQKIRQEAINGVQALFKAFKVTDAEAQADLTKIGVPPDQANDLLDLWKLTRALPSKVLTVQQLSKAYGEKLITREQFIIRAVQLGYVKDDAELLASLVVDPRTPGQIQRS